MDGELITSKTPIKYWGGKQQLASRIIDLIPQHRAYIEPFFGGGAVFFAKPDSRVEIINDISDNMVNFYRTIIRDFDKLKGEIDVTLYSEHQYKQAKLIWHNGNTDKHTLFKMLDEPCDVMRAWAVFVLSWQSFSGNFSSWGFSDQRNSAMTFDNMKRVFDERYVRRLKHTQIFCRDALSVMGRCIRIYLEAQNWMKWHSKGLKVSCV